MTPEPNQALQTIMGTLMMDIAPSLPEAYRQANVHLIAFAAMLIATEYDRAAEVRVSENRDMRALFAAAIDVVADGDLRARLSAAATATDPDLRVSQLTATNNELRQLLIQLHAAVECESTPEAGDLVRRIWEFLKSSMDRRAIQVG